MNVKTNLSNIFINNNTPIFKAILSFAEPKYLENCRFLIQNFTLLKNVLTQPVIFILYFSVSKSVIAGRGPGAGGEGRSVGHASS